MDYILALDQGTTSSRALVFDPSGGIVAVAQREIRQIYPRPGWVEHDPREIWTSQLDVAREAIAQSGVGLADIAGIGITNQRETTVLWDRRTGEPVHNAIVWQDRRTAFLCDDLRAQGLEATFTDRTGLVLDPYFSATKLRWMLDQDPTIRARAEHGELAFGTVDSWLIWNLTKGRLHVTDATNASRTLLYDIRSHEWDDHLLALMRIPRSLLPQVCPSSGPIAEADAALLGRSIPIAGVAGDQHAALFGQRCTAPGMVKNTYGTGCFMLMNTGQRCVTSPSRLLSTIAWHIEDEHRYALEGSVFVAGAVVQWLRDGLGVIVSSNDVEALASTVPDNGGVYLVPALTGLGAPHWDPHARGAIFGLTRGANRGHLARAALESIAFQSADLVQAMEQDSGIPLTELRVDGGAVRNDLLMQFQADLLGVPVVRPRITETTALGAAYLAGIGVGVWASGEVLDQQWQIDRSFEPRRSADEVTALRSCWQRAVERSKHWADAQ